MQSEQSLFSTRLGYSKNDIRHTTQLAFFQRYPPPPLSSRGYDFFFPEAEYTKHNKETYEATQTRTHK